MTSTAQMCINSKAEEELVQESEPSVNYARNLGKIGAALARHLEIYPDCFRRTGSPYTPEAEDI